MREHDLKCWPEFFERLLDYSKPFEFRKNDRDYQPGDVLHLREWDPAVAGPAVPFDADLPYTGRACDRIVTYVLRGSDGRWPGLAEGYCVLGLFDDRVKELRDDIRARQEYQRQCDRTGWMVGGPDAGKAFNIRDPNEPIEVRVMLHAPALFLGPDSFRPMLPDVKRGFYRKSPHPAYVYEGDEVSPRDVKVSDMEKALDAARQREVTHVQRLRELEQELARVNGELHRAAVAVANSCPREYGSASMPAMIERMGADLSSAVERLAEAELARTRGPLPDPDPTIEMRRDQVPGMPRKE